MYQSLQIYWQLEIPLLPTHFLHESVQFFTYIVKLMTSIKFTNPKFKVEKVMAGRQMILETLLINFRNQYMVGEQFSLEKI